MAKSSRSGYCQEQAIACGTKASTTVLPDIKEAYLNLEQAWLLLVPDFDAEPVARRGERSLGNGKRSYTRS